MLVYFFSQIFYHHNTISCEIPFTIKQQATKNMPSHLMEVSSRQIDTNRLSRLYTAREFCTALVTVGPAKNEK